MLARQQHVGGLDVAVHEPGGVRGVQAGGHLGDDARGAPGGERALVLEAAVQVGPVDVAHDQVQAAVVLARGVHGHEVGMVDRRGQARLEREARAQARVARPVGGDHLDGDGAAQVELRRAVDDAHPAAAGDRLDPAARDLRAGGELERGVGVRRGRQSQGFWQRLIDLTGWTIWTAPSTPSSAAASACARGSR